MKKILVILVVSFSLASCGGKGDKKQSAASIAQEWCNLNGKAYKAPDGPEKETAEAAVKKFEKDMEAKYKDNEAFMKEIENEVEKCEDASEGRK